MIQGSSWCAAALIGCAVATGACASAPSRSPHATLPAYADEADLQRALSRWREHAAQEEGRRIAARSTMPQLATPFGSAMPAAPAPSPAADATGAAAPASESITNVQTAGVDEGGIVKRAGDHLIVLRRGRLFTVQVGGDSLEPGAAIDAFAPGIDPSGAWYDELLVSGTTVVVIGYSYARGGTEVGLFELAPDGRLEYRTTYHLRSFDYYSSRNYASRLIGRTLIFYTPTVLLPTRGPAGDPFPGVRRWSGSSAPGGFQRILPATRIHRTDDDFDPAQPLALHTVTRCELRAAEMNCDSTAVLGGVGRVFYVSQHAVYVWTAGASPRGGWIDGPVAASVYRLPLDGRAPSAMKARGVPIDMLSFLESDDGHLNVLLRESSRGEGMWGSERTRGTIALLRVPIDAFGDGRGQASSRHYRPLPGTGNAPVHNRFVGDWLLWSAGDAWATRYANDREPDALRLAHAVERIEPIGADALLVGRSGRDLHFTGVRLSGEVARIGGGYVHPDAQQSESRTHGFFYRPTGADHGMLGLPVVDPGRASRGVHAGPSGAASVLFLRQHALEFAPLGRLHARASSAQRDNCRASCVDWYGNARPIFVGERVFALMGYELVEGRIERDGAAETRLVERRRIDFLGSPAGRW